MQLTYISVQYYRSITDAYKLDLSDMTVLLGKNNKGKTNIIRSINLGMTILNQIEMFSHNGRRIPRFIYDWNEDFPKSFQTSKRLKDKSTKIRMDFTLNEEEITAFQDMTGSSNNGNLSVYIVIDMNNKLSITLPKRGKNASSLTRKIVQVSHFICQRFTIQYIPAVRAERDAYNSILNLVEAELSSIDDDKYRKAYEYIESKENECLAKLANKVTVPLKRFIPEIRGIELSASDHFVDKSLFQESYIDSGVHSKIGIYIDDGVKTSLANKGDGVKSLITIAMLSQLSTNMQRLIIVDEPENHLHPEALHYIDSVLRELSKTNQVLISTHSPIFVNRDCVSSNLIVNDGRVDPAKHLDKIRDVLGIVCSDNLMGANYVIAVEGPSDVAVVNLMLDSDPELAALKGDKLIVVDDFGGTHNLRLKVSVLNQMCCNYLVILDNDEAGKKSAKEIIDLNILSSERVRYLKIPGRKETELEDFYNPDIYRDYLKTRYIDIGDGAFKNLSKKWSDRISTIVDKNGDTFGPKEEAEIKEYISSRCVQQFNADSFIPEGYEVLKNILNYIRSVCLDNLG